MKTITPHLDSAVLARLRAFAAQFAPDFPQSKPARWAGAYLRGLLADGERKSIEPLARRVPLPPDLTSADPEQALQQFVSQSPWDEGRVLARYRGLMAARFASPAGVFILDDTSFPKRGRHSVGVQHQYCGALGKRANCQVAVTLHYAGLHGHFPVGLRLHLPESWAGDPDRMAAAGVPEPFRSYRTKGEIALELLDLARAGGLAGSAVVADAGYGHAALRQALAERGLRYVVGVKPECVLFAREPAWVRPARGRRGPAPDRWELAPGSPRPVAVSQLAAGLRLRRYRWRDGSKGGLSARFAWVRAWPGQDWHQGTCAHAEPLWLLVEARDDGTVHYALSNLPPGARVTEAVRLWKERWKVEQGHQQMKEELGLDHFEGRSWRGFHHHAALVFLAFGFLLLERDLHSPEPRRSGKKGVSSNR